MSLSKSATKAAVENALAREQGRVLKLWEVDRDIIFRWIGEAYITWQDAADVLGGDYDPERERTAEKILGDIVHRYREHMEGKPK